MTPAKIYPFSIPAGGSFPLLVIGDYCKILTSSGPLTLQGDTFGSIGPVLAGQGVQDSPFRRLVLEDESGATNNGTILIADNAFIDDRITGSVEVIDGGKTRTNSGMAFSSYVGTNGVAGNFTHAQIFNPAGSNKNVILKSFTLSGDAYSSIYISPVSIELTTFRNLGVSKKSNGDDGVARLNVQNNPVVLQSKILMALNVVANAQIIINFQEPLLIVPGTGVNFVNNIPAVSLSANLEFYEEAIL